MINKRFIDALRKNNKDIADAFEKIGKLSDAQYQAILKEIQNLKEAQHKKEQEQKKEKEVLKKSEKKIKDSTKKSIERKTSIKDSLLSIVDNFKDTTKDYKTLSGKTKELIETTEIAKNEASGIFSFLQKKNLQKSCFYFVSIVLVHSAVVPKIIVWLHD